MPLSILCKNFCTNYAFKWCDGCLLFFPAKVSHDLIYEISVQYFSRSWHIIVFPLKTVDRYFTLCSCTVQTAGLYTRI